VCLWPFCLYEFPKQEAPLHFGVGPARRGASPAPRRPARPGHARKPRPGHARKPLARRLCSPWVRAGTGGCPGDHQGRSGGYHAAQRDDQHGRRRVELPDEHAPSPALAPAAVSSPGARAGAAPGPGTWQPKGRFTGVSGVIAVDSCSKQQTAGSGDNGTPGSNGSDACSRGGTGGSAVAKAVAS